MTATLQTISQGALCTAHTLRTTYDIAKSCLARLVVGDFVECGVWAGAQIAAMALAVQQIRDPRTHIHAFDSFSGIPQAGEHDIEFLVAGHPPGLSACSVEQFKANMRTWGIDERLIEYHEGLFQDTVPRFLANNPPRIALLRLDGDLYESTKACMPLTELVSPGGWIIIDDFKLSGCRKAVLEYISPGPIYFQP